jgi:hypothetical protein
LRHRRSTGLSYKEGFEPPTSGFHVYSKSAFTANSWGGKKRGDENDADTAAPSRVQRISDGDVVRIAFTAEETVSTKKR